MTPLLLALLACASPPTPAVSVAPAAEVAHPATAPARSETYAATLAAVDATLAGLQRRIAARPTEALLEGQRASALLQRARLTGDYDDYARAEGAVQAAFARSPEGAGPFLTRASLNYSLHRLERVEADLVAAERAVLVGSDTRASLAAMRASLALQQGDAVAAEAGYRAALALHDSPTTHGALAIALSRQDRWDEAEAALDTAAAGYHGHSVEPLAWIALHRGIFDLTRERLDEALVHYDEALAIMPGWWLAQEHVAEIAVLQGRSDQALALYTDVVARTGLPEFMDAIAGVLADQGQPDDAARWRARARQVYERQLRQFPEAAAGHALQHYLDAGDRPAQALALAQANAAIRPNAEALGLLAQAYGALGRDRDAADAAARARAVY